MPSSGAAPARRSLEPLAEIAIEIHDALFGLLAGLLRSLGDIDRGAQKHLAFARMAGRLVGFAISADVRGQFLERAETPGDDHPVAEPADRRKGVGAVGGD